MSRIDQGYIDTIGLALDIHRPCRSNETPERVRYLLGVLAQKGVRPPNDWQPEWTGAFCMRWYDGDGDFYGRSSKSVRLTIDNVGNVKLAGSVADKYSQSDSGFSIPNLTVEDAVTILIPILKIIDAEAS